MVCSDMKTGSEILASTKFLYDRFSEALKVLGAGNGTGTVALIAALHSFYDKPHILGFLKSAAAAFAIGVLLFAVAYTLFMFAYKWTRPYSRALLFPVGNLNTRYRCFLIKPFHESPPK
jgi:hypothetical protein